MTTEVSSENASNVFFFWILDCEFEETSVKETIKHLMTGPKGNSEFCFPETLNVPRGEAEGSIEVEGKQNSLFLEGPVIKCFVIPSNSNIGKKLRKYDLYERQSRRAALPKLHHDNSRRGSRGGEMGEFSPPFF